MTTENTPAPSTVKKAAPKKAVVKKQAPRKAAATPAENEPEQPMQFASRRVWPD